MHLFRKQACRVEASIKMQCGEYTEISAALEFAEVPTSVESEFVHKTGKMQLMISIAIKVDSILFFISFLISCFYL